MPPQTTPPPLPMPWRFLLPVALLLCLSFPAWPELPPLPHSSASQEEPDSLPIQIPAPSAGPSSSKKPAKLKEKKEELFESAPRVLQVATPMVSGRDSIKDEDLDKVIGEMRRPDFMAYHRLYGMTAIAHAYRAHCPFTFDFLNKREIEALNENVKARKFSDQTLNHFMTEYVVMYHSTINSHYLQTHRMPCLSEFLKQSKKDSEVAIEALKANTKKAEGGFSLDDAAPPNKLKPVVVPPAV